ncbi:MAG: 6,7-dimethyl-8-ribityllumazine synthase [Nitrospinae bacterium]|nr:6,7-dimethyl-8-ribityllumazine synthase [Nitrospinota bacterium]
MPRIIQGDMKGSGYRFGIVVSRFNEFITGHLLEGAIDALIRHGVDDKDIEVVKVPGSFEIPYVAKKMAIGKRYNAIICLGAIIQGDTSHYKYIASEVTKGIASISLETGLPIILGVLTTETIEQGIERAGSKSGNKGWDAAISAIEMVNLYKEIEDLKI